MNNRAQRRADGWTERRLRKKMHKAGMLPREALSPILTDGISLSSLGYLDPDQAKAKRAKQHKPRLEGKPRRWQVERERRHTQKASA